MKKIAKSNEKRTKEKDDHFLKARKSFLKMQKEIEPFIKRKPFKQHSTAGEWSATENLYFI